MGEGVAVAIRGRSVRILLGIPTSGGALTGLCDRGSEAVTSWAVALLWLWWIEVVLLQ